MEENIAGLEVSMDDALRVGVVKGGGGLFNDWYNFGEGEPGAFLQYFAQGAPRHIGHDEIGQFLLFAIFIDRHDIDMVEGGDGVGLAAEACEEFCAYACLQKQSGHQHFHGHSSSWSRLLCEVDCAHAPAPKHTSQRTCSEGVSE